MTCLAWPKPATPCCLSLADARPSSPRSIGRLSPPSMAAPPIRINSRRVTPSQSTTLLPGMDNMITPPLEAKNALRKDHLRAWSSPELRVRHLRFLRAEILLDVPDRRLYTFLLLRRVQDQHPTRPPFGP